MQNILILATELNELVNPSFLLKLAGNQVTPVTEADEALNFLLTREKVGQPFDCLLLVGDWHVSVLTAFLDDLTTNGLNLSVYFASKAPLSSDVQTTLKKAFKGLRCILNQTLLEEVHGL